jgi:hypothetical protein
MKTKNKVFSCLSLLTVLITFSGCFASKQPIEYEINKASQGDTVETASKCHIFDGSIIIFRQGFTIKQNMIYGTGERYYFINNVKMIPVNNISMDSVIAITTYEDYSGGRVIANVSLGIFGTVLTGTAIYCAFCPKCCFGSCPTVYSFDGSKYSMETELFSQCISKQLEGDDLDMLLQKVPDDGSYKLKVTNEALETHYINKINLILAEHPSCTNLFTNTSGGYTVVKSTTPPQSAVNRDGINLLSQISSDDNDFYRSRKDMVAELKNNISFDWIELNVPVPQNSGRANMVIRYRNTLLSTILFYDIVLGSQGIHAVDWTSKMNNDHVYAKNFKMIYDAFSGIQAEFRDGDSWKPVGKLPDSGPIAWKYMALEVPSKNQNEITIRLKFVPDNFMIDYIGFDFSDIPENKITYKIISPFEIINKRNDSFVNINNILLANDGQYLVTNPGESLEFNYKIDKRYDAEQTLFISSGGYYYEWVRGSWIRNNTTEYKFDLYRIKETLNALAESWEKDKELIESEFFRTRIPIKEK